MLASVSHAVSNRETQLHEGGRKGIVKLSRRPVEAEHVGRLSPVGTVNLVQAARCWPSRLGGRCGSVGARHRLPFGECPGAEQAMVNRPQ
jgi:hypothetical protein